MQGWGGGAGYGSGAVAGASSQRFSLCFHGGFLTQRSGAGFQTEWRGCIATKLSKVPAAASSGSRCLRHTPNRPTPLHVLTSWKNYFDLRLSFCIFF